MENIFKKMDDYWNSDESFLDEFRELDTERLLRLQAANQTCLTAMEREGERYWEWREKQPDFYTPHPRMRKPLDEVKKSTERALRLVRVVLAERKNN